MKKYNIAVVGATGMVGRKFLQVLEERKLPVENYYLFASKRSAGKTIKFMGKDYTVLELTETCFDGKDIDIALFSAGGSTSEKFAPIAAKAGAIVVDNSSAWRMDPEVPLVVPEVNPQDIEWNKGIIANPNCSTIRLWSLLNLCMINIKLNALYTLRIKLFPAQESRAMMILLMELKGKPRKNSRIRYTLTACRI